jgi:hypothetical protein
MSRTAKLPEAFELAPVTLEDARRRGVGAWRMRTHAWQRVGPGIFVPAGVALTAELRIAIAARRLPVGAAFSGFSAAWLHRLGVPLSDPIEITVPSPGKASRRSGMRVHRQALGQHEVVQVRGHPATSVLRTLQDLSARISLTELVVLADVALHERLIAIATLPGALQQHVEPKAASPMETRMRMEIVLAGLPRPLAQVPIYDQNGVFAGTPDLYYPEQRLGIEYDGGSHRTSLAEDNRRQNALLQAGVRLLRFTAADILGTPERFVALVRHELGIIPHRSVAMAEGKHPFPFRTRKLSPPAPMVLSG